MKVPELINSITAIAADMAKTQKGLENVSVKVRHMDLSGGVDIDTIGGMRAEPKEDGKAEEEVTLFVDLPEEVKKLAEEGQTLANRTKHVLRRVVNAASYAECTEAAEWMDELQNIITELAILAGLRTDGTKEDTNENQ